MEEDYFGIFSSSDINHAEDYYSQLFKAKSENAFDFSQPAVERASEFPSDTIEDFYTSLFGSQAENVFDFDQAFSTDLLKSKTVHADDVFQAFHSKLSYLMSKVFNNPEASNISKSLNGIVDNSQYIFNTLIPPIVQGKSKEKISSFFDQFRGAIKGVSENRDNFLTNITKLYEKYKDETLGSKIPAIKDYLGDIGNISLRSILEDNGDDLLDAIENFGGLGSIDADDIGAVLKNISAPLEGINNILSKIVSGMKVGKIAAVALGGLAIRNQNKRKQLQYKKLNNEKANKSRLGANQQQSSSSNITPEMYQEEASRTAQQISMQDTLPAQQRYNQFYDESTARLAKSISQYRYGAKMPGYMT